MKIQIRKGVFETNSSSIHTLTLNKVPDGSSIKDIFETIDPEIKEEVLKNGLYFGTYQGDWNLYRESKEPEKIKEFKEKLDNLWERVLGYSQNCRISYLFKFFDILESIKLDLGLPKIEYNKDPEYIDDTCSLDSDLLEELDDSIKICRFIFFDNSNFYSWDRDWYYQNGGLGDPNVDLFEDRNE